MSSNKTVSRCWRYLKPMADGALVVLGFVLAYLVRYELQWLRAVEPTFHVGLEAYLPTILMLTPITVLALYLEGAYKDTRARPLLDEFYLAFKGTLSGIAVMTIVSFYAGPWYYSRLIYGYAGVIIMLLLWLSRSIEAIVIRQRQKRGIGVTRLLLVGADENARAIMRAVVARPELGYQIVGFVDDDPNNLGKEIARYPSLGTTADLPEIIETRAVDEVIITLPWMSQREIMRIMGQCRRNKVRTRIVPDLFQMTLRNVVVDSIDGVPLLGIEEPSLPTWQDALKRTTDVIVASVLLVVLMPLFVLIAIAIKVDSPGPALFRQRRLGRGGKEFVCLKFRTMCANAEELLPQLIDQNEATGPIFKMRNDPRRTRVGRLLRHGLDELPQLWNVLKGEMSLVGPRPPIPSEVAAYEPWQLRRLDVRPGITGLWQVSGRSNLTFDEMVLLDLYYIENWSPLMDLGILLKTIPVALVGSGGY